MVFFTICVMLLVGWAFIAPDTFRNWIAEIRRQFRQSLVEKYGNLAAKKLAHEFKAQTIQAGFSLKIAEELLQEQEEEIIHQLGNHYVDELLND